MLEQKITDVVKNLEQPVSHQEATEGWSLDAKKAIETALKDIRQKLYSGVGVQYTGLVRTLDAWGIEPGGDLYEKVMDVSRIIDDNR